MDHAAPAAKPPKPKDGREKITLLLSKETNVQLSTLAALNTEALRGVVISLRGALASGEGRAETADPEAAQRHGLRYGKAARRGVKRWRKAAKPQVHLDANEAVRLSVSPSMQMRASPVRRQDENRTAASISRGRQDALRVEGPAAGRLHQGGSMYRYRGTPKLLRTRAEAALGRQYARGAKAPKA